MHLNTKGVQLLDQALAGIQAKDAAARNNAQDAQQRYYAMLLSTLPQSQQQATVLANPNWQQAGKITIPYYQPSQLETTENALKLKKLQNGLSVYDNPDSAGPGGAATLGFYNAAGVLPPADLVKKNVQIGTYRNADSLPPDAVNAQRVEDKLDLDANQKREGQQWSETFNKIDLPTSSANIGHMKAMTVEQLAAAGNQNAQAGKNAADARRTAGSATTSLTGGTTGDDFLATLPKPDADLIRSIVEYKADPTKIASIRGDQRQKLITAVLQYDPTFDMSAYPARSAVRKSFTSGTDSGNVTSLNTAIAHLKKFSETGVALGNRSLPAWNAVANFAEQQTGDPRVVEFLTAANAVVNEVAKVFKGTGATSDSEIKEWRHAINSSQSPEQIRAAISTMVELIGGRLNALNDKWTRGMGKPRDFAILSPQSVETLKSFGADPSTMDALAIGGASTGSPSRVRRYDPKTGSFTDK